MNITSNARLLQMLYRVAITLIVAMLIVIPVQIILCPFILCCLYIALPLQEEYKSSFMAAYLTQFKLE